MTSQANVSTTSGSPPPANSRSSQNLSYMHRPPTIIPNYGKKYGSGAAKLKTNVPRVLLYDNVTQQTILDFHLSGLQSQQHKTYREMEMHMNSFSLRSKAREKSLKNITKVPHWSDYDAFLEEFQHQDVTNLKSRRPLPRVNNARTTLISSSPNRRKKRRRTTKKSHSDPGFSHETSCYVTNGKYDNAETSTQHFHLPHIDNNSSVSLVSANGKSKNFEPKRPVGFSMETSEQGMTRLFHTLPTTDASRPQDKEPVKSPVETTELGNELEVTEQGKEPNTNEEGREPEIIEQEKEPEVIEQGRESEVTEEGNGPEVLQEKISRDAIDAIEEANLPETNKPLPGETDQPYESGPIIPQVDVESVDEVNLEEPSLDYRFEKLERMLIPQDPPGDGFIELSPSFEKKYFDTAYLEQYKRPLKHRKFLPVTDQRDARSAHSEHTLDLEDDEDDDEDETEDDKHGDNEALVRLGNF